MSLNAQPLNALALNGAPPPETDSSGAADGTWVTRPGPGALGRAALNTRSLNGTRVQRVYVPGKAEIIVPQFELRSVYLLEIEGIRIPMSSFQATVREEGLSFVQAVIPDGSAHVANVAVEGALRVLMGYLAPDDTLTALEEIASAPAQTIRHDLGGTGDTLTVSGYGKLAGAGSLARTLEGVSYRSVTQGRRRVRCSTDLLLRPGHVATDNDGATFIVGEIQYFINARNEWMEVVERG
ncbi:hypothetical protein [Halomonas borealis]|uniref:hypothetical protein n=1 Tax=Halomonas borealis TaxID=2508710 RepID=UPI0010A01225|nr:hypothetical protein [Halomonas borealis]